MGALTIGAAAGVAGMTLLSWPVTYEVVGTTGTCGPVWAVLTTSDNEAICRALARGYAFPVATLLVLALALLVVGVVEHTTRRARRLRGAAGTAVGDGHVARPQR
jgi:hypothetical protein